MNEPACAAPAIWLAQKDLHEWQQVMSYLQRRRAQNMEHMVGENYGPREARRRELVDTVGKTVQTIVESYYRNKEASELAASVETAVAQTALLEVGNESESAITRLKDGVAPYTRYIRSERECIEKAETSLANLRQKLSELRARSQAAVGR